MKPFKKNEYPSLGVEEEFHLIDPNTADLCPRVNDVMTNFDPKMRERLCHELLLCVLESRSNVCLTSDELVEDICHGRQEISKCCGDLGVTFAAGGSHPFGKWKQQPVVESDHYRWVLDKCRYVANRLLAFGLHIHVGVKSVDAAMYIINQMRRWAYPLLALSANSPYYEGIETGLASTRAHLFGSMPRSGLAPEFKTFSEIEDHYGKLVAAGDVTQPGDLWWSIRPQPPFGTVEFRFFDLPTSVKRVGALSAIVQAATAMYQDRFFSGDNAFTPFDPGYLEQNRWRAMKDGLNAMIIEPETGEVISIKDQLQRLIDFVYKKAGELGSRHHIEYALEIIDQGNEADIQKKLYKEFNGDMRALELELARQTMIFV
jgi:carboxylate-amine ligase